MSIKDSFYYINIRDYLALGILGIWKHNETNIGILW